MLLYKPLHNRLCRFVQTLVWDAEEAKDVVSETTLIAFERFDSLRQPEQFLYFLFSIAHNLVKKKSRRKKFWGLFESSEVRNQHAELQSDTGLLRWELYKALQQLSEKQREAIVLFEINGFSIKEISVIQQLSESGVKSNLVRGRDKLSKLLAEHNSKQVQLKATGTLSIERRKYAK